MQQLRNTQAYNSDDVLRAQKQWFLKICEDVIPGFIIDEHNKQAITKLFQFILRLKEFEEGGFSLNKGILLLGPYGTGKTDLMKIAQRALLSLNSPIRYRTKVMWQLAELYTQDGYEMSHDLKGHLFIDEMGVDDREIVNYMGNRVNISDVVIMHRYNDFKNLQHLSHFTSNKTLKQLKEYLDGRSFDRLMEMCNVIALAGDSRRGTAKPKEVIPEAPEETKSPEPTLNLLEFIKKHIADGKPLEVLPLTELYRMLIQQQFIKPLSSSRHELLYEEAQRELIQEYDVALTKLVGIERQSTERKRENLFSDQSIEVLRRMYKKIILEEIK